MFPIPEDVEASDKGAFAKLSAESTALVLDYLPSNGYCQPKALHLSCTAATDSSLSEASARGHAVDRGSERYRRYQSKLAQLLLPGEVSLDCFNGPEEPRECLEACRGACEED